MTLLDLLLLTTDFHSPPSFPAVHSPLHRHRPRHAKDAVAIPSVIAGAERYLDVSGSATPCLAVGARAKTFYLPALGASKLEAAAYAACWRRGSFLGWPRVLDVLTGVAGGGAGAYVTSGMLSWRQLRGDGNDSGWGQCGGVELSPQIPLIPDPPRAEDSDRFRCPLVKRLKQRALSPSDLVAGTREPEPNCSSTTRYSWLLSVLPQSHHRPWFQIRFHPPRARSLLSSLLRPGCLGSSRAYAGDDAHRLC
ncbi:hypothetical protein J3F83DRAFT_740388 [Trichoderma novae-zelandiae]